MVKPLKDKESNKFDSEDRVKVSIEQDNTVDDNNPKPVIVKNTSSDSIPVTITNPDSGSDVDVTVKNTSSDAIPVEIVNTDTQVDLEVNIAESITIDSSTPVDVNLTNSSVDTNATIVGTPNVNVSNSELTTRNQLEYTATDITALGSSTDVTTWTSALADGVLTKEFVSSYQNEFEQITLYTHPDLGDNDKALKKITQYSTQNGATVIESVDYEVVTWDKDLQISGSVSVSASNLSPADPSNSVAIHTRVADLTITDNTLGDVTISLSGTNASLYHIHNMTANTFASSMTYIEGNTYQLHTASDFSGASYSHSVTITVTGVEFGVSDSTTVSLIGTYTGAASWANEQYVDAPYVGYSSATNYQYGRLWNLSTAGLWPSLENQTNYRDVTNGHTLSMWIKRPSTVSGFATIFAENFNRGTSSAQVYFAFYWASTQDLYLYQARNNKRIYKVLYVLNSGVNQGDWFHLAISVPANETHMVKGNVYINGNGAQGSNLLGDTSSNLVDINNQYSVATNIGCTLPNRGSATGTYTGANAASGDFQIDELTTWSKALTQTQIQNLKDSNSAPIDPTTHAESASLERHLRFGDGANDGPHIIDEQDASYQLTAASNVDYTTALTSSDSIYVPASGSSWANDYYITKTNAASNTAKSGINSGSTISNTLTSSWSISFWFKSNSDLSGTDITDGNGVNDMILISPDTLSSVADYYKGFVLRIRGRQLDAVYVISGANYIRFGASNVTDTLFNGSWHNVIVTHSGTSNSSSTWASNCKVYIDNGTAISVDSSASGGSVYDDATVPFFGKGFGSGNNISNHVSGMTHNYDEMAVWTSTALDSTARTAIYNSGTPTDLENTTGVTAPSVYYRGEDNADLGYETIADSNTTNETNIQQVAY